MCTPEDGVAAASPPLGGEGPIGVPPLGGGGPIGVPPLGGGGPIGVPPLGGVAAALHRYALQ